MNTNLYSNLNNCAEWRIYKDSGTAYKHGGSDAFYALSTDVCYGGKDGCESCYFSYVYLCLCDFVYLFELLENGYISITPKSYPEFFI